jgi:hemoglobin-like flavoprotein
MTLSKPHKTLVKHSFPKIAQAHESVSTLFYEKLFDLAPQVRPLFQADLDEQRVKLMQMLALMIATIDDDAMFMQMSQNLGLRHTHYGVKPEHYAVVGEALLWALKEACPTVMTAAVYDAWHTLYNFIAEQAVAAAIHPDSFPGA